RAAFDRDRLSGEVARIVTQQEDCDVADVAGLRVPADRYPLLRAGDRVVCRERASCHRRVDTARADAIRSHIMRAVLHCQQTRQRVDAALAGGVPGTVSVAAY